MNLNLRWNAEQVRQYVEAMVTQGRSTCLTCVHFDQPSELCNLAQPRARPPAKVIAYGCKAYQGDDVPF